MTQQEQVEQNVRMALGDLMLQTIILKARIAELEAQETPEEIVTRKQNGKARQQETRPE